MIERLPHHHLPDHLLLEYTAGALAAPLAMLVACHLTLCPSCRTHVQRLEAVAGALLEAGAEVPVEANALEALLAHINDLPTGVASSGVASSATAEVPQLPRPLRACLPKGELKWRRWLPGVRGMSLNLQDGQLPARLVKFSPGIEIPMHDHEAIELVLVLDGEIIEEQQRFLRGDVAVSEPGHVHTQRVHPGSSCTALIVNQGPLIALTKWGRLLKLITGV